MMKPGYRRQFCNTSRAWYGPSDTMDPLVVDEIMFGVYATDGGTAGEMAFCWRDLGGRVVPYLKAYDDAWAMLADMPDLIAAMGKLDDSGATPAQIEDVLLGLGFVDATPTNSPYVDSPKLTAEEKLAELIAVCKDAASDSGANWLHCQVLLTEAIAKAEAK